MSLFDMDYDYSMEDDWIPYYDDFESVMTEMGYTLT
jgi:hypothetical protein